MQTVFRPIWWAFHTMKWRTQWTGVSGFLGVTYKRTCISQRTPQDIYIKFLDDLSALGVQPVRCAALYKITGLWTTKTKSCKTFHQNWMQGIGDTLMLHIPNANPIHKTKIVVNLSTLKQFPGIPHTLQHFLYLYSTFAFFFSKSRNIETVWLSH